jgi:hypothetical protein
MTDFMYYIGLSFHQPKFCPNASWNPYGINFANTSSSPYGLFIDINDAVYATEQGTNSVGIWSENGTNPIRTLSGNLNNPGALFVSTNGDIFVDNGRNGTVVKWTVNGTSRVVVMNVSGQCLGLFIDINNTLYCSLGSQNKVVKMSLNGGAQTQAIVVGTGSSGASANMLNGPNGIFVDVNFTLYVADWGNNRIQRFYLGQLNGTTVVGGTASVAISLSGPTGVMMDGSGYLFVVDNGYNRIVGSGPYGFRCIVACSMSSGSSSTQLNGPRTLGFDSNGNLYVSDYSNNRIQKFILIANSCGKCSNI